MSNDRKARIDSVSEAVRVVSAAAQEIVPPSNVPLEVGDLPFFASVIADFARTDWTAHQLELAAMLARTMADLEREQMLLRQEGFIAFSLTGLWRFWVSDRAAFACMKLAPVSF